MLKKLVIAAAIMIATPGILFSQDIFLSHVQNAPVQDTLAGVSGSNSLFVYVRNDFEIGSFDLDLNVSDSSVVSLSGASVPNSAIPLINSTRWATATEGLTAVDAATNSARLFGLSTGATGISPQIAMFDEDFQTAAGALGSGGAFLLATIDYDIVGPGTATFSLSDENLNGVIDLSAAPANPEFGQAVVSAVPEPSSAVLLALGLVGFVARRRRSH